MISADEGRNLFYAAREAAGTRYEFAFLWLCKWEQVRAILDAAGKTSS
jgi:hypothetical protein